MKSASTLRRELRRIEEQLALATDALDHASLFGAAQALAWALGQDAMRASLAFAALPDNTEGR